MSQLSVLNRDGKETSKIKLPEGLFGKRVNTAVLHQATVMYQASLRQGTASTKERADVSGGGKKPYRQKGTGRARQGSIRAPQFRGGGTVFGPHPRDFGYSVPKKIRRLALRESLNAKFQDAQLFCIEDIKEELKKTKDFAAMLKKLGLTGKTLGILDGSDPSIVRISRNIARFSLLRSQDVNAYDVLRNKNVLISKTAFEKLVERINAENASEDTDKGGKA